MPDIYRMAVQSYCFYLEYAREGRGETTIENQSFTDTSVGKWLKEGICSMSFPEIDGAIGGFLRWVSVANYDLCLHFSKAIYNTCLQLSLAHVLQHRQMPVFFSLSDSAFV